jgi:hypothetical protein
MTPTDIWRLANLVIAAYALVWLVLDLSRNHGALNQRRLFLTISLAGLLFAVVVGSVQRLLSPVPPGPATALVTASCLWCVAGLWVSRGVPG